MWNYYLVISIVHLYFVADLQDNPYNNVTSGDDLTGVCPMTGPDPSRATPGSTSCLTVAALERDPERNVSCGIDFTGVSPVNEGRGRLEDYPWLGIMFYPVGPSKLTTVVVLVTRQLAIVSANEIDKVPKDHFRALSRVVLGTNCSSPGIKIRDYIYHPEYATDTNSALALLQLEVDHVKFELHPICSPPTHFIDMQIYALTLNEDCEHPVVNINRMEYVDKRNCKLFYRRAGLDEGSLWPTHSTCARAVSKKSCVWRGGAPLAVKQGERWHLLGFGVYGPGCQAPARFMDYVPYTRWVKTNVARIGMPATTRISPSHLILRRSFANLQRFGQCDPEEVKHELYTDKLTIPSENIWPMKMRRFRYNLTLVDIVDYSCVIFKVTQRFNHPSTPILRLGQWNRRNSQGMCHDFQFTQMDFYVEVEYVGQVTFKLAAYGRKPKVVDPRVVMARINSKKKELYVPKSDSSLKDHMMSRRHLTWSKVD